MCGSKKQTCRTEFNKQKNFINRYYDEWNIQQVAETTYIWETWRGKIDED